MPEQTSQPSQRPPRRPSVFAALVSWTARAGEEEQVGRVLAQLSDATSAEPGCLGYAAGRSLDDPYRYVIYESYIDEDAFKLHLSSEHFRVLALEDGIPRLASRTREFFSVVS
jgi:(4S)-4-hydroxy-5-phosphonooxypentane-2,3-dione isomerase